MTSESFSGAAGYTDDLEEAADIAHALAMLDRDLVQRIDQTQWLCNFQNAHSKVSNVIRLSDSFFHRDLARRVYVAPSFPLDFERLRGYTFRDSDELTVYGLMIVKVRSCAGYLGNLAQGDLLSKEHCAALTFAYEAFWKFGEDYVLDCVVEALMRRIGSPSDWTRSVEIAKGLDDAFAQLDLGLAIGVEMSELFAHHRSSQRGTIEASFGKRPKSTFIEFRQRLDAIKPPRKASAKK
jgi:hypothetical protein